MSALAPLERVQSLGGGTPVLRRLGTVQLTRLLGAWRSNSGVAYLELAAALRRLVVEGTLSPYTRLPSERALAEALGVSRNTATAALGILREDGYLAARTGIGSWIVYRPGSVDRPDEPFPAHGDTIDLSLANLPAPPQLSELALRAARALGRELGQNGYEPFGLPVTRDAIAGYLTGRGLPTEPAQILVTQGALHAFDLTLRALTEPGARVLVETPTYPAALDAIRAHRCIPIGVPIRPNGWDLDMMGATLRDAGVRLGYLVPEFQNPTGVQIPAEQRAIVARQAAAVAVPLVSDESLAELWLDADEHPPSLAACDEGVLLTGSLSKPVWGGLRVGWIRADPQTVRRLALARSSQDIGNPVLDQLLAVEVLDHLDELLPDRRALLRDRRKTLLKAVAEYRPEWQAVPPAGGMSTWAQLPPGTAASALANRAAELGVRLAPGPRFSPDGGFEQRLRLPFTQTPDRLADAVRRLATAEDQLSTRDKHPQRSSTWVT